MYQRKSLVTKLMVEFQHYGLGDTQYLEIIKSYRGKLWAVTGTQH